MQASRHAVVTSKNLGQFVDNSTIFNPKSQIPRVKNWFGKEFTNEEWEIENMLMNVTYASGGDSGICSSHEELVQATVKLSQCDKLVTNKKKTIHKLSSKHFNLEKHC